MASEKSRGGQVTVVKEFVTGPRLGVSARTLYRDIFRSPSPEEVARNLPAQSIYLAIRGAGLDSSSDLLPLLSDEQYKVVLDFDLWDGEVFSEKKFWSWLNVLDQEPGREAIEGFLHVVDARLLGILIARNVEVEFSEEKTEGPLAPGFYTPDEGSTWLRIKLEDPEQHRRFGKMLAIIYENDAELFYQLLAESGYVTTMELEESAFQDKSRRLWDEGFPDQETSYRLNTPIPLSQLDQKATNDSGEKLRANTILPLAFSMANLSPLNEFLAELEPLHRSAIESELALLANTGIVHYEVDISEPAQVNFLIEKIRGAMNIGLERLEANRPGSAKEVFAKSGLQRIYQLGLYELKQLGSAAQGSNLNAVDNADDPILVKLQLGACEKFPVAPRYLLQDGSLELSSGADGENDEPRAYTHLRQLEAAKTLLRERCAQ